MYANYLFLSDNVSKLEYIIILIKSLDHQMEEGLSERAET